VLNLHSLRGSTDGEFASRTRKINARGPHSLPVFGLRHGSGTQPAEGADPLELDA